MALWKEPVAPATTPSPTKDPLQREPGVAAVTAMTPDVPRRPRERADAKESIIAADLTIEGKIEGSGHVRIAGSFKGDVHVQGNLTIEAGARLTGQVRANTVTVGGELQGNIEAAARVELLETGIVAGDVKAASLTVAAGSRMRGQVEFGWEEKTTRSFAGSKVDYAAS
ncbi:MAG TPA: polymer-forming cytoskeletal protein [Steroidobacteraceae bacterium]|nr:polymer-forming cytoskeletal protein [Steroidobacteraceae bacterium]